MAYLTARPVEISSGHYSLTIDLQQSALRPRPGQFINIKVSLGNDPLLRRPFSIFNYSDGVCEIIVHKIGRGTGLLCAMEPGPLDSIGPLGNGFTLIDTGSALLVGGGVGTAPLYYLARQLRERGVHVTCVYGARSENYIYRLNEFNALCAEVHVTTNDGSIGYKGVCTDRMKELVDLQSFDMVYTCGPEKMMQAVCGCARNIPVEVSLENYFGCGVGICSGCVFDTVDGYKRACVDGPVYDGKKILWK